MSNAIYRVLVIDDNIENRKQLENHLKTKGHLVQVAGDGQEGLDMLCAHGFDLILTGINLPKLNGFELLEQMNAHPDLKNLPVIIISAVSDMQSVTDQPLDANFRIRNGITITVDKDVGGDFIDR